MRVVFWSGLIFEFKILVIDLFSRLILCYILFFLKLFGIFFFWGGVEVVKYFM